MADVQKQRDNNVGGITGKGFKPGQSGNPGGRPKGTSVTARLRALLEQGEINGQPIKDGKQVADLLAEVIVKNALQGDHRFVETLLNRADGKVPDVSVVTTQAQKNVDDLREHLGKKPKATRSRPAKD